MLDHPDVRRFVDLVLPWLRTQWPTMVAQNFLLKDSQTTLDPLAQANVKSKGECNAVCASSVVRKITGLSRSIFHQPNQSHTLWCDKDNPRLEIFVRWFVDLQADVEIRGLHAPSKIRLKKDFSVSGHMEGSIVIQVPWTTRLDLGHPIFVVQGSPLWSPHVQESDIPETAMRKMALKSLDESLQEASEQLQSAWTLVSQALQDKQTTSDWSVDLSIEGQKSRKNFMPCVSSEKPKLPLQGCDPCDTCCQCMISKECTDACKACPCLNCSEKRLASYMPIVTFAFLSFVLFLQLWIANA